MSQDYSESQKIELTNEIYLGIFNEPGVAKNELEDAICSSYNALGHEYKTINDIPLETKIEAICDCCKASGLKFNSYTDILDYFTKNYTL